MVGGPRMDLAPIRLSSDSMLSGKLLRWSILFIVFLLECVAVSQEYTRSIQQAKKAGELDYIVRSCEIEEEDGDYALHVTIENPLSREQYIHLGILEVSRPDIRFDHTYMAGTDIPVIKTRSMYYQIERDGEYTTLPGGSVSVVTYTMDPELLQGVEKLTLHFEAREEQVFEVALP